MAEKRTEQQITQEQIKQAVTAPTGEFFEEDMQSQMPPAPFPESLEQQSGMPPVMEQPSQYQDFEQAYPQQQYPQSYDYQQYSYPSSVSSDTITEIAEQVVSEKLSKIKTQLEKTIDVKSTAEAKLSHLEERLQRIEKIIDELQLSILQKVGEQMTSVSDLKKELFETQKSFNTISRSQHPHIHHEHNKVKHKKRS